MTLRWLLFSAAGALLLAGACAGPVKARVETTAAEPVPAATVEPDDDAPPEAPDAGAGEALDAAPDGEPGVTTDDP